MTKIIFLDIDGVLNSHKFFSLRKKDKNATLEEYLKSMIDPDACLVLKCIVDKTHADVVLSSTWRLSHYDFVVQHLESYGIPVIDKTGKGCCDCFRGNVILKWCKDNEDITGVKYYNYKNYVILDDDSDMLYWQKDNFVKIKSDYGLTNDYVDCILSILNQE